MHLPDLGTRSLRFKGKEFLWQQGLLIGIPGTAGALQWIFDLADVERAAVWLGG